MLRARLVFAAAASTVLPVLQLRSVAWTCVSQRMSALVDGACSVEVCDDIVRLSCVVDGERYAAVVRPRPGAVLTDEDHREVCVCGWRQMCVRLVAMMGGQGWCAFIQGWSDS